MYVQAQNPLYSIHSLPNNQNPVAALSLDIFQKIKALIVSPRSNEDKAEEITKLFIRIIHHCDERIKAFLQELDTAQELINRLKYENSLLADGVHHYEDQITSLEIQKVELLKEMQKVLDEKLGLMEEKSGIEKEFDRYKMTVLSQRDEEALAFSELEKLAIERKNRIDALCERIMQYSSRVEHLTQAESELKCDIHTISEQLRASRDLVSRIEHELTQAVREKEEMNHTLAEQVRDLQEAAEQTRQTIDSQASELDHLRQIIMASNLEQKINAEIQRIKLAYINNDDGTVPHSFYHRLYNNEITDPQEYRIQLSYKINKVNPLYWTVVGVYKGANYLLSCERARKLNHLLETEKVNDPSLSEKSRLDQVMTRLGYAHFLRREEEYLQ